MQKKDGPKAVPQNGAFMTADRNMLKARLKVLKT